LRNWVGLTAATLGLLLAGCSQPPADTRAADEKALRENEAVWNKDWVAKDLEKLVSHYADDASLLIPQIPLLKGKDAVRGGIKHLLDDPAGSLSFTTESVEVSTSGDLAYTRGSYTIVETDEKTKQPVREQGKYVTVYRKGTDGSWKAVIDMNNADAPPVPLNKK
jgi:uncharacterized protein (TIGR02246 family)